MKRTRVRFKYAQKVAKRNEEGCCLNWKVVNHLYYADDLVLMLPTASRMNELLRVVCEQFSEKFGLKFNEQKTVLLYLMPEKLNSLDDNGDIKRQLRSFYGKICYCVHSITVQLMWKNNCFPLILVVCILATCGAITVYGSTGKCMSQLDIIMFSGDSWVTICGNQDWQFWCSNKTAGLWFLSKIDMFWKTPC